MKTLKNTSLAINFSSICNNSLNNLALFNYLDLLKPLTTYLS